MAALGRPTGAMAIRTIITHTKPAKNLMVEFSVIIPIYNEELNIPNLLTRLRPVVEKTGMSYELLFVNDGSRDSSLKMIKALPLADSIVPYIDSSRTFGN